MMTLYVIAGLCCTSNKVIHVHIDNRMCMGNPCYTKSSYQIHEGKWHTHTHIYIYHIFTTPYWLNWFAFEIIVMSQPWVTVHTFPLWQNTLAKTIAAIQNIGLFGLNIGPKKIKIYNTHAMSRHSPGPEVATIRWFVRITEFWSKVGVSFTRLTHCVGLLAEFNLTR